jgi:hypothetical protein
MTRHPPRNTKEAPHPLAGLPKLQILLQWKMWRCAKPVNVTLNQINGVGQKSKDFWDHIHRKYCLFLKKRQPIQSTAG